MIRKTTILFTVFCLLISYCSAQTKFDFDGQASWLLNYSPQNNPSLFTGIRYLPKATLEIQQDSTQKFDFECSLNLNLSSFAQPFDSLTGNFELSPYRIWTRYSAKQFEVRVGLQKIDFGSATLLRPLQWFNQIDPRDPLQITNGVYGVLSRYYFLNNTNIWVWGLLGNKKPRGYDFVESNQWSPEVGTRIQLPVPKGELALSYHFRTADTRALQSGLPSYKKLPENRLGLDGKWDLGIGLWFEYTYLNRMEDLGPFTSSNILTIGTDYTFPLGSGLNVVGEHMIFTGGHGAFEVEFASHISAVMFNYPVGFFDRISLLWSHSWDNQSSTVFLNYQHQFKHITSYFMVYYNPKNTDVLPVGDQTNNFEGPGVRVILVYNHSGIKRKKNE